MYYTVLSCCQDSCEDYVHHGIYLLYKNNAECINISYTKKCALFSLNIEQIVNERKNVFTIHIINYHNLIMILCRKYCIFLA